MYALSLHYFSIFNALWQINNTEFSTESEILTLKFFSSNRHSKSFQLFLLFCDEICKFKFTKYFMTFDRKMKKKSNFEIFSFFLSSFSLSIKVKCNADGTIWTLVAYHSDPKFSKKFSFFYDGEISMWLAEWRQSFILKKTLILALDIKKCNHWYTHFNWIIFYISR